VIVPAHLGNLIARLNPIRAILGSQPKVRSIAAWKIKTPRESNIRQLMYELLSQQEPHALLEKEPYEETLKIRMFFFSPNQKSSPTPILGRKSGRKNLTHE
jgi:hypothetical protein